MPDNIKLSKTRFVEFWRCACLAWLHQYKPEEMEIDEGSEARIRAGHEVGEIARQLYGDYVDVTEYHEDFPNLPAMIHRTRAEIEKKTSVICEASFSYSWLYCAVDILRYDKENDGWQIIEVKSSTHADKEHYLIDVSYQLYVLSKCGVKVTGVSIAVLNRNYVFDGTLDINQLFKVVDVTDTTRSYQSEIRENIKLAREIMLSADEPLPQLCECKRPYLCPFYNHCHEAPLPANFLNHINVQEIRDFLLDNFRYPLCFLDFETLQPVIPRYIGTRPYDQVCFQYSAHYIEHEGGPLLHKEFLADPDTDPRRAFAEHLVADVPSGACVVVYNKTFERTRLKGLAEQFPDLKDRLLEIRESIVDLMVPFQKRMYYLDSMHDSYSIKAVLPALFPDDPELSYANLPGIHNGSEAMNAFPAMVNMTETEREQTRQALLKYCALDTLAMVRIWQRLRVIAQLD